MQTELNKSFSLRSTRTSADEQMIQLDPHTSKSTSIRTAFLLKATRVYETFWAGGRQTLPYRIMERLPVRTKPLARRTLPRG